MVGGSVVLVLRAQVGADHYINALLVSGIARFGLEGARYLLA